MAAPPSSTLDPPRQPLFLPFLGALLLHGGLVFVFALWSVLCVASKPVLDLNRTVEVSFVEMKRAEGLPTIATRTPEPQGVAQPDPQPAAAPEPPTPAPEPPPVQSDLVLHQPEPAPVTPAPVSPAPPAPPDRSADRQRALDEARRAAALEQARIGSENVEATDPNGTSDRTVNAGGVGNPADPELARWKVRTEALFTSQFNPIQDDPNLSAVVQVRFDPDTGRVLGSSIRTSSGNASFDAAATRAAAAVTQIDTPPDRFRDIVGSRLDITFEPPG